MNSDVDRLALSVGEAAKALSLSRSTIYRLIEQKKLVTLKIGSRRLVRVSAINAMLNESVAREG